MGLPRRTTAATTALIAMSAAVGVGCGSDPGVVGSVRVGGSSALLPLVQESAAAFTSRNPLARVNVDLTGTDDGFALLCDGIAGAVAASRSATPREQRACAASGVRAVPLLVGRDAIVVVTGPRSRVPACLSTRDLAALTGASRTPQRTWDGPGPAGVPVQVVVPEAGSATREAFVDRVIARQQPGSRALRGDAVPAAQGRQMLARVTQAPGAIGISSLAAVEPLPDTVRVVEVDDGDGCVAPSADTVASEAYPLTRDLVMAVRTNADGTDGDAITAFGDVVASGAVLDRPGSGLSPDDIQRTEQAWRNRAAGGIGR